MTIDPQLEKALRSSDPVSELRRLAERRLDEGDELAAVREEFERVRQKLREAGREEDEDAVMDVLDFLTGWRSPHVRLGANDSGQD